ncbi:MAG: uncharacterized protein JWQ99_1885 [Blastococcus sp.]|jgi:hypothetical protein|nr:uncharacterized protein [Blastococcus sp.]
MSMADRDGTDPESLLPDTAMDTGSDAGGPGSHLGPGDLEPDEERLLAALERDTGPVVTGAPPDSAVVRAAEDEVPLPAKGGVPDDGLTPRFVAPEAD